MARGKSARKIAKSVAEETLTASTDTSKKAYSLDRLKNPKVFIPLIVIVIAALLFYFRGLLIVAVVNGAPISRFSVISELEKRDGRQILSTLIAQTLILQEAQKRKISVSQQEVEAAIKQIEASLTSQGQNLDQALSLQGMTRDDFLKQIKIQKLVEKMFSKDVKVTDKEIADYIDKNKDTIPANAKKEDLDKSVKQQLEQQKLSTAFQTWLSSAQKNAKIMYFVNY